MVRIRLVEGNSNRTHIKILNEFNIKSYSHLLQILNDYNKERRFFIMIYTVKATTKKDKRYESGYRTDYRAVWEYID
jgi:ATP adenylyltransferase/5',5'''-P-1,P-4-tetraphosphate phosphorylase II